MKLSDDRLDYLIEKGEFYSYSEDEYDEMRCALQELKLARACLVLIDENADPHYARMEYLKFIEYRKAYYAFGKEPSNETK